MMVLEIEPEHAQSTHFLVHIRIPEVMPEILHEICGNPVTILGSHLMMT